MLAYICYSYCLLFKYCKVRGWGLRWLGMGQIPHTMMLRVVQEIYHSSFRIPLSLRLRGIRKLVVVYFLYSTQYHCISYIVPYLCAIAQSNHLIYRGTYLVYHGKKTCVPRLKMSLHCFVYL